ncbi:uncharacterized protein DUF4037 [Actinoplanes lutulentus]|uniref:Uncharacterized protein DUF4037 n=1 Tax=Actinoplanes lutulentus TaxID=1287878 RepID=A0A327Z260_9ACTN|nr:uncharacterized protein DUF4037 [Actinoplanes lutulentus]
MGGAELSGRLYAEGVRPLLSRQMPAVVHSACLIGGGSEVLGFDTARSTDHDWGPRLQLFLTPADLVASGERVRELLAAGLPGEIAGYPTNLVPVGERGTRHMVAGDGGPVQHGVEVTSLDAWLGEHLGFDPRAGVSTHHWLSTPTQRLAEVTGGAVHHDGLGQVHEVRRALAWYPDDISRYIVACQWQRVGQEEAFVGRCGEVGDELGSAVVAARLVRDLMRLCLLIHRRYPPYSKWLGSAFARLPVAAELIGPMVAALAATDWRERERHLVIVYEAVAGLHDDLGLDPRVRFFHDRPFRVLGAERYTQALIAAIDDPAIRALPLTGAIDQYADNTDLLTDRRVVMPPQFGQQR